MKKQPKIILIVGPNGAGKTTFAREYLPHEAGVENFLNVNFLAQGLAPFAPESAAAPARRLLARLLREHLRQGRDVALETTFSTLDYARQIPTWWRRGYRVELIFLGLAAPELSVARVGVRAQQGGHAVEEGEIRRRFAAGLLHFKNNFQTAVDRWAWFDNSGPQPVLVDAGGRRVREKFRDDAFLALRRSGYVARQLARQRNTPLFIWRDGQPSDEREALAVGNRRVA